MYLRRSGLIALETPALMPVSFMLRQGLQFAPYNQ
jgi:hypothetical protein